MAPSPDPRPSTKAHARSAPSSPAQNKGRIAFRASSRGNSVVKEFFTTVPGGTGDVEVAKRQLHMGIILIEKSIVVCSSRQQSEQPATARVKARGVPVSGVESWSPRGVQTPKKDARGVHRRPRRGGLSLVFLVFLPVSD